MYLKSIRKFQKDWLQNTFFINNPTFSPRKFIFKAKMCFHCTHVLLHQPHYTNNMWCVYKAYTVLHHARFCNVVRKEDINPSLSGIWTTLIFPVGENNLRRVRSNGLQHAASVATTSPSTVREQRLIRGRSIHMPQLGFMHWPNKTKCSADSP